MQQFVRCIQETKGETGIIWVARKCVEHWGAVLSLSSRQDIGDKLCVLMKINDK